MFESENVWQWDTKEGDADGISVFRNYFWCILFGLIAQHLRNFVLEMKHIATDHAQGYGVRELQHIIAETHNLFHILNLSNIMQLPHTIMTNICIS